MSYYGSSVLTTTINEVMKMVVLREYSPRSSPEEYFAWEKRQEYQSDFYDQTSV